MSAAQTPSPQNMMLLALLGIGTYYVLTRRAQAAPVVRVPAGGYSGTGVYTAPVNTIMDAFGRILSGGYQTNAPGTWDGRSAQPWDTSNGGNNPSAWLASSANDGLAVNPVNVDPWDYYATLPTGFF